MVIKQLVYTNGRRTELKHADFICFLRKTLNWQFLFSLCSVILQNPSFKSTNQPPKFIIFSNFLHAFQDTWSLLGNHWSPHAPRPAGPINIDSHRLHRVRTKQTCLSSARQVFVTVRTFHSRIRLADKHLLQSHRRHSASVHQERRRWNKSIQIYRLPSWLGRPNWARMPRNVNIGHLVCGCAGRNTVFEAGFELLVLQIRFIESSSGNGSDSNFCYSSLI